MLHERIAHTCVLRENPMAGVECADERFQGARFIRVSEPAQRVFLSAQEPSGFVSLERIFEKRDLAISTCAAPSLSMSLILLASTTRGHRAHRDRETAEVDDRFHLEDIGGWGKALGAILLSPNRICTQAPSATSSISGQHSSIISSCPPIDLWTSFDSFFVAVACSTARAADTQVSQAAALAAS